MLWKDAFVDQLCPESPVVRLLSQHLALNRVYEMCGTAFYYEI